MPIQWIDTPRTQGYQVRATISYPKVLTQFFAARKHGGKVKAKAAAEKAELQLIADANRQRRELGLLPLKAGAPKRPRQHVTGEAGLSVRWLESEGWLTLYFQGSWVAADGTRKATAYSAERHGVEGAAELALNARRHGRREPLATAEELAAIMASLRRHKVI